MNGRASCACVAPNSAPALVGPASSACERQLLGPGEAVGGRGIFGEEPQQRVAEKRQRRPALADRQLRGAELLGDLQQLARVRRAERAPGVGGERVSDRRSRSTPVPTSVASCSGVSWPRPKNDSTPGKRSMQMSDARG